VVLPSTLTPKNPSQASKYKWPKMFILGPSHSDQLGGEKPKKTRPNWKPGKKKEHIEGTLKTKEGQGGTKQETPSTKSGEGSGVGHHHKFPWYGENGTNPRQISYSSWDIENKNLWGGEESLDVDSEILAMVASQKAKKG